MNDATLLTYAVAGVGSLLTIGVGMLLYDARDKRQTLTDHGERMVRIETVLTGADGGNGLNSEVKTLRKWRHDEIVPFQSKTNMRLTLLEERRGEEPGRRLGDYA